MKKQFLLLIALLCSTLSFAQEITFTQTTLDYGTIPQNSDGTRIFHFSNTGDYPLVVSCVKTSCGCLVASHPKEPIMPGESSFIKAKYDTTRKGRFTKYVTLTTNDKNSTSTRLKIHGTVVEMPTILTGKEKIILIK